MIWRNKVQAMDPCIGSFTQGGEVAAVAVSATRFVCGTGQGKVLVYDLATEELLQACRGLTLTACCLLLTTYHTACCSLLTHGFPALSHK